MEAGSSQTDADLVTAFVASHDEVAFGELVRRHGPMVLGVCRRTLGSPHDAEDAFQVTFTLLARKADEIHPPEQVGRWLYGVAQRTALKARGKEARRRSLHARIEVPTTAEEGPDLLADDLRETLDEELARLPEKYLAPVVLCDLEGRTYRAAAHELNLPVGTLSNRLAAAHRLLAGRLARRGVVPCGGLTAALALSGEGTAPVSASLSSVVIKACAVEAGRHSFFRGVMDTMLMSNLVKAVAALVVTFSLALGAVQVLGPAQDKDAKELEGDWTVVSAERAGKKASGNEVKAMKVTIKGGVLTIQSGAGRKEVASLRLNSSTTPKSIDLTPVKRPETEQGIYKIDKGRLTLCWGAAKPGERQKEFSTSAKGGGRLVVLERAKAEGR